MTKPDMSRPGNARRRHGPWGCGRAAREKLQIASQQRTGRWKNWHGEEWEKLKAMMAVHTKLANLLGSRKPRHRTEEHHSDVESKHQPLFMAE